MALFYQSGRVSRFAVGTPGFSTNRDLTLSVSGAIGVETSEPRASIDTPEIRGDCLEEKSLALQGRAFANDMFRNADTIEFRNLKWDKYGGRILADVYIDGMSYKHEIIEAGLAREYDGGKKLGWCD